jgi:predicted methyltransferase
MRIESVTRSLRWFALATVLIFAACAMQSEKGASAKSGGGKSWKVDDLKTALATPTRPQPDRDRDADRKPADLMMVFGVKPGMTAVDVIAAGGYMTEVLSIAVGPTGKVYLQNPQLFLQFNNGANAKAVATRLDNNRLPNVVRLDGDLPGLAGPNSADVAITVMNLHDVYNRSPQTAQAFVKSVYDTLKPGGVFGVVDHVGVAGADNAKLHRMQKQQAIDVVTSQGFKLETDSNVLAHAGDDHTKGVFDGTLRGKTDQFTLVFRKPK